MVGLVLWSRSPSPVLLPFEQPAQLGDDRGEAASVDILHDVIGDVADGADAVNGHDARMLEPAGDLGLELKPLERPGIAGDPHRQHFQGDPPRQRWLLGLINDAHAAAADLTHDAEVAKNPCAVGGWRSAGRGTVGASIFGIEPL